MSIEAYIPVVIQLFFAVIVAVGILGASALLGQRSRGNYIKDAAYECGMISDGNPHARFAVKFYVIAMLFILFDIEVVFLVSWVLVFRDFLAAGIPVLLPILFFLAVLVLGLVYEMKKGALEWEA